MSSEDLASSNPSGVTTGGGCQQSVNEQRIHGTCTNVARKPSCPMMCDWQEPESLLSVASTSERRASRLCLVPGGATSVRFEDKQQVEWSEHLRRMHALYTILENICANDELCMGATPLGSTIMAFISPPTRSPQSLGPKDYIRSHRRTVASTTAASWRFRT